VDHPELHYYQGFHDVCSVCLMVCHEPQGAAIAEAIATRHLKDNMRPSFDVTLQVLSLLFPLVALEDQELFKHIDTSGVDPHFAISWNLTWLSHNIDDLSTAARLFDFFISTGSFGTLYVAAMILVQMRKPLLLAEAEYTAVYSIVQKLPKELPFDEIIASAAELAERHPPEQLANIAQVRFDRNLMALRRPPLWAKRALSKADVMRWMCALKEDALAALRGGSRAGLIFMIFTLVLGGLMLLTTMLWTGGWFVTAS